MVPHLPYFVANSLQTLLSAAVLVFMIRSRELKTYWPLLGLALWQAPAYTVLLYVRFLGRQHITPVHAYSLYFNTFWSAFAVSAICSLILPYILFRAAMRPLKGLQDLGNIMFTWVAVISTITAVSVAIAPGESGSSSLLLVVSQLERLSGILIVSLVAFVAVAIRPLGLSMRSRVFGVSVGTLLVALTNMLQAATLTHMKKIYSTYSMVQLTSSCIAQAIWIYYLARPEPERNFISLPTTSPFHYWNDIARRLDQDPGVVAIGGFNPKAFAGAEVEVFRRASAKMQQQGPEQNPHGEGS